MTPTHPQKNVSHRLLPACPRPVPRKRQPRHGPDADVVFAQPVRVFRPENAAVDGADEGHPQGAGPAGRGGFKNAHPAVF